MNYVADFAKKSVATIGNRSRYANENCIDPERRSSIANRSYVAIAKWLHQNPR